MQTLIKRKLEGYIYIRLSRLQNKNITRDKGGITHQVD